MIQDMSFLKYEYPLLYEDNSSNKCFVSVAEYCGDCSWQSECGGSEHLFYRIYNRKDIGYSVYDLNPQCSDFAERVTEVNGFSLSDIHAKRYSIPKPPNVIPLVRKGDFGSRWGVSNSCIATGISPLVYRKRNMRSLRSYHKLSPRTLIIVTGCCKDQVLENLWLRRDNNTMLSVFRLESPCLFIAPDFSLYANSPRCCHMYNTKRSLIVFERMQAEGIPVIPFVSLHNSFDVRRWGNWLNNNTDVTMAAMSFQTLKHDTKMWEKSVDLLRRLDIMTERRLHWIIIGVAAKEKMTLMRNTIQSLSIIASKPVVAAARGELLINGKPYPSPNQDKLLLARRNLIDLESRFMGELSLDFFNPKVPCHSSVDDDSKITGRPLTLFSEQLL